MSSAKTIVFIITIVAVSFILEVRPIKHSIGQNNFHITLNVHDDNQVNTKRYDFNFDKNIEQINLKLDDYGLIDKEIVYTNKENLHDLRNSLDLPSSDFEDLLEERIEITDTPHLRTNINIPDKKSLDFENKKRIIPEKVKEGRKINIEKFGEKGKEKINDDFLEKETEEPDIVINKHIEVVKESGKILSSKGNKEGKIEKNKDEEREKNKSKESKNEEKVEINKIKIEDRSEGNREIAEKPQEVSTEKDPEKIKSIISSVPVKREQELSEQLANNQDETSIKLSSEKEPLTLEQRIAILEDIINGYSEQYSAQFFWDQNRSSEQEYISKKEIDNIAKHLFEYIEVLDNEPILNIINNLLYKKQKQHKEEAQANPEITEANLQSKESPESHIEEFDFSEYETIFSEIVEIIHKRLRIRKAGSDLFNTFGVIYDDNVHKRDLVEIIIAARGILEKENKKKQFNDIVEFLVEYLDFDADGKLDASEVESAVMQFSYILDIDTEDYLTNSDYSVDDFVLQYEIDINKHYDIETLKVIIKKILKTVIRKLEKRLCNKLGEDRSVASLIKKKFSKPGKELGNETKKAEKRIEPKENSKDNKERKKDEKGQKGERKNENDFREIKQDEGKPNSNLDLLMKIDALNRVTLSNENTPEDEEVLEKIADKYFTELNEALGNELEMKAVELGLERIGEEFNLTEEINIKELAENLSNNEKKFNKIQFKSTLREFLEVGKKSVNAEFCAPYWKKSSHQSFIRKISKRR